jgi:hypothetical protein
MHSPNLIKAGVLALCISILALGSWEIHLRNKGWGVSYDNNMALWANKRGMVYEPRDQSTVFIGSSRIKYDLDIPTWQKITGDHAVQLALEGTNPRPVLENLANDPHFSGKLIVDVTEEIFFSEIGPYDEDTKKKFEYFKNLSPTQRCSFQIDHLLESQFSLLDQHYFSISAMLSRIRIPVRPGTHPEPYFPIDFNRNSFDRQSSMTARFVADTNLQNQQKAIWSLFASMDTSAPVSGAKLEAMLNSVKTDVDKIKSRGGEVLFVRTPSSGPLRLGEMKGYPRRDYWDRLLAVTGCPGVYFTDYPAIAGFTCPEWSHLKREDAVIYTKNLIKILQEEKGWTFSHKPSSL